MKTLFALFAAYFVLAAFSSAYAAEEAKMIAMLHCVSVDGQQASLIRVYDSMATKTDRDPKGATSETVFEVESKLIKLKSDGYSFLEPKSKVRLHVPRTDDAKVAVDLDDGSKQKIRLDCTRLQGSLL